MAKGDLIERLELYKTILDKRLNYMLEAYPLSPKFGREKNKFIALMKDVERERASETLALMVSVRDEFYTLFPELIPDQKKE